MVQHGKVYLKICFILSCQTLRHVPWPSFTTPYLSTTPLLRLTPLTTLSHSPSHLSHLSHSLPFHLPFLQILALKDSRPFRPRYIESGFQPLHVSRFTFHLSLFTFHFSLSPFTFSLFTDSCAKIRGPPDLAILNRAFSPWMLSVSLFTLSPSHLQLCHPYGILPAS